MLYIWQNFELRLLSRNLGGFPGGSVVKSPPANEESWVRCLIQEAPTFGGATRLLCHSCWACAERPGAATTEPVCSHYWSPHTREPPAPPALSWQRPSSRSAREPGWCPGSCRSPPEREEEGPPRSCRGSAGPRASLPHCDRVELADPPARDAHFSRARNFTLGGWEALSQPSLQRSLLILCELI